MKNLKGIIAIATICLLSVGFLGGCSDTDTKEYPKTINAKSYRTVMEKPMPSCICRYWYNNNGAYQEFEDSCYKYQVGDTLVGSKKTY